MKLTFEKTIDVPRALGVVGSQRANEKVRGGSSDWHTPADYSGGCLVNLCMEFATPAEAAEAVRLVQEIFSKEGA